MKLRNAIFALGFAIAFTFGSFTLNAGIDAPMGVIDNMVIDSNNDLGLSITCNETARLSISTEGGTLVYSNDVTSGNVTINTGNWARGTYVAVLIEEDGSIATKTITL